MKIKILLLLLFVTSSIFAQTTISDGEEVSGTWKKSGSPYIIEGEAIVPSGKTLKIKHGVEVKFKVGDDRDYRYGDDLNPYFNVGFLRVEGTLIAKGKKNKMITFTHNENSGYWGNVVFINSNDNELKYCHFEFSYYIRLVTPSDNGTGAISFINSRGTVENCLFAKNGWTAINCKQGSNPKINNCTITDNNYGIECNSKSVPKITNSIIWKNKTTDLYVNGSSMPHLSYSLLTNYGMPEGVANDGKNISGKDPKLDSKYKLKKGSPCEKAGNNKKNIGAF